MIKSIYNYLSLLYSLFWYLVTRNATQERNAKTTTTTLESATPDHTRDDTRNAEHRDTGTRSTRAVTA